MKNRFAGQCNNCGEEVKPKKGYWRLFPKGSRDFSGLRCKKCAVTYKRRKKEIEERALPLKPLDED